MANNTGLLIKTKVLGTIGYVILFENLKEKKEACLKTEFLGIIVIIYILYISFFSINLQSSK